MDEKTLAETIRSSWGRWLADASDAAVVRFHMSITELLETELNEGRGFGYGVINHQLLDEIMLQPPMMALDDESGYQPNGPTTPSA